VIGVLLDGIENALRFEGNFSTRPVAWQNRDAMVTHASSHMALLHERDPFHRTKHRWRKSRPSQVKNAEKHVKTSVLIVEQGDAS
jgi:hypothetical protein